MYVKVVLLTKRPNMEIKFFQYVQKTKCPLGRGEREN